ncbi:MAG: sensor histidine kinase [Gaiellaceae bacterium]
MPSPPTPPDDPASSWSLERRLPLLISALLACAIGAYGAFAYRETRVASVGRAADRLESTGRLLAQTSAANAAPRNAVLRALAADPAARAALADTTTAAAFRARFAAAQLPTDTTVEGWVLWATEAERRVASGAPLNSRDADVLAATIADAARTDSIRRSPLYGVGGRVFLWTVLPVHDGARTVGFLAEHRRLPNSPRAEVTVRRLIGDDVRLAITSRGSGEWAVLSGHPVRPIVPLPDRLPDDSVVRVRDADGRRLYAVRATVPGTPWQFVLMQPQAEVLRRPHDFLRRLLAGGLVLLLAGALGAWLLSRHVTRPLHAITDAAEAIAAGEYGRRVGASGVGGGAELARLATTFDAMGARVEEAHAELADRHAALELANAAKSQFLAMMSHELRTPLNAIGGYTELLQLGLRGPVTQEQEEDLGRIRRNKDQLLTIINDLLSFSQLDVGTLALVVAPVTVAGAMAEAAETVGPQLREKGLELRVEPPGADLRAAADRDRLQQILVNLLTNAARFTERGSVVLAADADDTTVRLRVTDTGCGIPADKLEEVFEPFVQVDSGLTRRVGGTGLGLAI